MQSIHQNDDLVVESIAARQEADRAMCIQNDLCTIIADENDVQVKNLRWLETHTQITHQWVRKIESEIQLLDEEIIYQMEKWNCLRKAVMTLKTVESINAESQLVRSTKLDGDYKDEVGKELDKEKQLIDVANSQLETGLVIVKECIERMKAAKQDLECLWSNKQDNYHNECDNINLKQSSSTIMLKFGSTRESNKENTRIEWQKNIEMHINLAQKLLTESYETHPKISECILQSNQRKLCEQGLLLNITLMKKKKQVEEYIHILETELRSVLNKQTQVEKTVHNIENSIKHLHQSLKLCQTRLYNRSQKPVHERFFDEAQEGLLFEEDNIRKQIFSLEKDKSRLEDNLRRLLSERIKIERRLQLKLDNSWIDGDQCPKRRFLYPPSKDFLGHKFEI